MERRQRRESGKMEGGRQKRGKMKERDGERVATAFSAAPSQGPCAVGKQHIRRPEARALPSVVPGLRFPSLLPSRALAVSRSLYSASTLDGRRSGE